MDQHRKKACPKSFTFIISNGDLLTYDRLIELLDTGLDAIKVSTALPKHILHLDYSKKNGLDKQGKDCSGLPSEER